ncbi:hypothetical protein [Kitasatospora mediocidica]|uniref:hypothetical protein n=1 Tax=Kitasatospora mediocidica TaxID=58352 RepID=UPI00055B3E8B|nr:hypothetical protein [Kitasatospora mediocidica]
MSPTAGRAADARTLARRCGVAAAATAAAAAQFLTVPAAGAQPVTAVPAGAVERGGPGASHRDDPNAPVLSEHQIPLTTRFQADMHGSITRIANTLMTCDETKPPVKAGVASCEDARRGVGQGIFNNNYPMKYVNIEQPGTIGPLGDEIYSSSSADLKLADQSDIKYARLYWGGTRGIGTDVLPLSQVDEVYFKAPGDSDFRDIANDGGQSNIGQINTTEETAYQASADVTDIVKGAGNGTYEVANLDSVVKPHSWGSWTLVVAYENCNKPLRRINLWDGFQVELPNSPPIDVKLNGFNVPADGSKMGAKLGYVAYDGDRTYTGDSLSVKTTNGPETQLSDAENPADDIMNSTITETSPADRFKRVPNYNNTFGLDADRFDISKLIRPGDTDLRMRFNTAKDGYQVGAAYTYLNLDDSDDAS